MFSEIMGMWGNYGQRKVARFENESLLVSTCAVTDSDQPFETAVQHPEYNDGHLVIVETYEGRDDAAEGHARWVTTMTADQLPGALVERGTSAIAKLAREFGADKVYERNVRGNQ